MTTRLSTQDIATVLVEELGKIEGNINQFEQLQNRAFQNLSRIEALNTQHIAKFEALTKRKITLDSSNFEQAILRCRTLPKWAIWALILQPLTIAIATIILVSAHISKVERVAWNEGYAYATTPQKEPPSNDDSIK